MAQDQRFRNGGEDAFAEIAVSVVHIEIGHRKNCPIGILLFVGQVIADQIADIGSGFLAYQFQHFLLVHFA